jgi:asparagine synthase (glutamine-hydrolysing)
LWDKMDKKLTLIRDRAGEKPLYYGRMGNSIMFASELKAFVSYPEFRVELNQDVVATYLRYGYIPAPHSIYRNIFKLLPGSYLQIDHKTGSKTFAQLVKYWSLSNSVAHQSDKNFLPTDDTTLVNELDKKLREAVSLQKVADVPLGAFLSGGIDSSTIVALMQNQSSRPIQTFTIGFNEKVYDEADHSRAIAKYLGTDHTELYVSSDDARNVVPDLPHMFDEPFGDSSAIPTFLVSKLARAKVTVSLSGDAGDELFGGYSQYMNDAPLWDKINNYPAWLRKTAGAAMLMAGTEEQSADPEDYYKNGLRKKLKNYGKLLSKKDIADFYAFKRSIWPDAEKLSLAGDGINNVMKEYMLHPSLDGSAAAMMYADANTYLPDDILTKVDRAAMSVSLETRVPMLDHSIMEFAFALPTKYKIRNGQGKWILRQVLKKYVPDQLVDRPKMGFGVPVEDWLNGSLREWAGDLLSYDLLKKQGIFNADAVTTIWKQQQAGIKGQSSKLWLILSFQAWLQMHANKK